ncbi:MAG: hypothetical protein M0Z55_11485 [Peptococcaceae bacterium]|nr:hypothetical protein [Peptococcaceae bacterium]
MSMPQIPEEKHRPTLEETVIDLLESIALEEIAISHLLNAEAEKTQVLVSKLCQDDSGNFLNELAKCNKTSCKMVDTVIIKEWLLLKKMETVLEIDMRLKDKNGKCECYESTYPAMGQQGS